MKETILNIIYEEFSKLINTMESDFKVNYRKKINNFLLNQLEDMTAYMVFVSSFESKSGNTMEACAKRIARLRYGDDNVPTLVNPRNIKHDIDELTVNGQIIITDVDTESSGLKGKIAEYRASNVASGRGALRQESKITQEGIRQLLETASQYKDAQVHTKPVDLAFYDGTNWNLIELKAGGDLDSSNAPSNIEKILAIYAGLNIPNARVFFATLYNKNGEGNTWTGAVKKHMAYPEMFLIGKNFWDMILPDEVSFNDFTAIYKDALDKLDLNSRIEKMIHQCLEGK